MYNERSLYNRLWEETVDPEDEKLAKDQDELDRRQAEINKRERERKLALDPKRTNIGKLLNPADSSFGGRMREAGDIVAGKNENDPVYRALGWGLGAAIGVGSLARKGANAAVGALAAKTAGLASQIPSASRIKAETKPTPPPGSSSTASGTSIKPTPPAGTSFRERLGNKLATGIAKTVGAASQAPSAVKQALDRARQSFSNKPQQPVKAPKMQMRNLTSSYDHIDLLNTLDQLDEASLDAYMDSLTDAEFELLEAIVNEAFDVDEVERIEKRAQPRPGDEKITKPWNTFGRKMQSSGPYGAPPNSKPRGKRPARTGIRKPQG